MSANQDIHVWLSTKAAAFVSWASAALGIGTAIGYVNLAVGVLSAIWLSLQVWNYLVFTLPRNRREAFEHFNRKLEKEKSC